MNSGELFANCDIEPLLRMLRQQRRKAERRHNAITRPKTGQ